MELIADELFVGLGPVMELTADQVALTLDPGIFDPDAPDSTAELLRAERITARAVSIPNWPTAFVDGLVIRRDGIDIDGLGVQGALAINDSATTEKNQSVDIDVLANDLSFTSPMPTLAGL